MSVKDEDWSFATAAQSIAWSFSFCFSCIVIGSLSDLRGWVGVFMFLVPALGAFQTSDKFSPDDYFNDTYTRFIIILSSHMLALCFEKRLPTEVSFCNYVNFILCGINQS